MEHKRNESYVIVSSIYRKSWSVSLIYVNFSSTFFFHIRKKIKCFWDKNVNIAISVNIVFNYLFDVVIVTPRYSWNTSKVDVKHQSINLYCANLISGVMVSIVASSGLDRGVKSWSGQTKDHKIGICCFSAKHSALMRKRQDWFAQNQNYVFSGAIMVMIVW